MRAAREASGRRRAGATAPRRAIADARLAAGPGLVAAAFGITRRDTGIDLCDPASPLRLEPPPDGEPLARRSSTTPAGRASPTPGEPWVVGPVAVHRRGQPVAQRPHPLSEAMDARSIALLEFPPSARGSRRRPRSTRRAASPRPSSRPTTR